MFIMVISAAVISGTLKRSYEGVLKFLGGVLGQAFAVLAII